MVVTVVNPFPKIVFSADVDFLVGVAYCRLAKEIIVLGERFTGAMQCHLAIFKESHVINQANGLRETAFVFHNEGCIFVEFDCGEAAFFNISHFKAHLLDDAVSEGIRLKDGDFVVDVLVVAEVHGGHDGRSVIVASSFADEHRALRLVDVG